MKYKINDQKFFSDITDGIAILIEVDTGIYYGLNALTTNIFENIILGIDTDKILDKLKEIKGFNAEIGNKYKAFLDELVKREIVNESSTTQNEINISINEFTNEDMDFAISEYRDVEELLLADPIHHVKEDKGWKPNIDSLK